jgi:hypothetical protein
VSHNVSKPASVVYTVSVLLNGALAREDLRWLQRLADRRYEFRLLAAADREVPELPERGWHDLRRLLKIAIAAGNGELRLTVQAEGYAALVRVANRASRLHSPDGVIDLRLGFDGAGRALAVLANTPEVRRALARISLTTEEIDAAAPRDPGGGS